MRYLLIDRILTLSKNKSIKAIRNISLSEDVFNEHFVGVPVVPGALLIESMAQCCTALIELSSNFKYKAILVLVKNAKFRAIIKPGDQLIVEASIVSQGESSVSLDCTVTLDQKVVSDSNLIFSLKPSEEFYPMKYRANLESLYEIWLNGAEVIDG